ncbi:MAG TPA: RtcB family protein [Polyangiaceae bacterium]|nr:RtcB family protein [Polyangiaceae bacterium]
MSKMQCPHWKDHIRPVAGGWFELETDETQGVPVRLFLTEALLAELEPTLYPQIIAATRFAGTRCVVITPDVHFGYGVPVGCVIATDYASGSIALGPVGFDIGCGMVSAQSNVPARAATPDRRLAFNREVMSRIALGTGGVSRVLAELEQEEFMFLVRGGAEAYAERFGSGIDRQRTERQRFAVDEDWLPPWGGKGSPERGLHQLGTLGGGNHFVELQRGVPAQQDPRDEHEGRLYVQIHTGSRGFGHGLATNYFELARDERPELGANIDLGYFLPESPHYRGYLNAVAAGANFAIVNRLIIYEQVSAAFRTVFREELELVYELSHNLVQAEQHPEFGPIWVHRKGATRALPAGHPMLEETSFVNSGHPVLIPGSNRDESYILRPLPGAASSLYSVNHGAGRRLSRGEANRTLDQSQVNDAYQKAKILVNDDGRVPLDESGACYKRSHQVVQAVLNAGLAEIEVRLWPLASIKGNDNVHSAEKRQRRSADKNRKLERQAARRSKRDQ